ncbi:MAG TPA: PD-(D/E)XK nuclease family protein, partial [Anaerolineaceae bacterium]|nr:PD-(D/E)XK nuclease family protein [Anaerolineaceae bacterium]
MTLPSDFVFSQQKLQDYLDCPHRFELRYLEQVAWPAPLTEPVQELERHLLLGSRFHQMVHRHRIGIPVETIERGIDDPLLADWWRSYRSGEPAGLPRLQFPEFTLTATLGGFRFVAKIDLLA